MIYEMISKNNPSTFIFLQVPPLTPGTNKRMGETLKSIYANWALYAKEHKVPENPINWNENHVKSWLQWTLAEFQFGGFTLEELVAELKVIIK